MRSFVPSLVALTAFLPLCSVAPALFAQDFTGTYTAQNDQGGTVTLVMQQTPQGRVTGRIQGDGTTFTLDGQIEQGSAIGTVSGPAGQLFFRAELNNGNVVLVLANRHPNGEPDYDDDAARFLSRRATGRHAATAA